MILLTIGAAVLLCLGLIAWFAVTAARKNKV